MALKKKPDYLGGGLNNNTNNTNNTNTNKPNTLEEHKEIPTVEDTIKASLKDSAVVNTVFEKPEVKVEAEVVVENAPANVMSRSDAVKDMNSDTTVVIDDKETYFERKMKEQQEYERTHPAEEEDISSMRPEIVENTNEIDQKFLKPKTNCIYDIETVVSEGLKDEKDLAKGMAQYYVSALYITDNNERKKYVQGTIITLPADVNKLKPLFVSCLKSGRLLKCSEMNKKVNREKKAYDSRIRKWVTEGTPEYDAYIKYMEDRQAKIEAAKEKKLREDLKKAGIR